MYFTLVTVELMISHVKSSEIHKRRGCIRAESSCVFMLHRREIGECQWLLSMAAFKAVTTRWKALCFVPSLYATQNVYKPQSWLRMQQSLASYACHQLLRVWRQTGGGLGPSRVCCLRQALLEDVCAAWCRAEPGELGQHCLLLLQLLPALSSAGTARPSHG